jgi:hypothetical protein
MFESHSFANIKFSNAISKTWKNIYSVEKIIKTELKQTNIMVFTCKLVSPLSITAEGNGLKLHTLI